MKNWLQMFLAWIGDMLFFHVQTRLKADYHDIENLTACIRDEIRFAQRRELPRPVFVHFFHPSIGIWSQRVADLKVGDTARVRYVPQGVLPAGVVVTVSGPATIENLCVGNQCQIPGVTVNGVICITRDAAEIGVYVHCELKGIEQ